MSDNANVKFTRPELSNMQHRYRVVYDCLNNKVKTAGSVYLPMPDASNRSVENVSRYDAYKSRAVFYNVTARTLGGLVGEIFAHKPSSTLPASLDVVVKDANGSGISLEGQAKQACRSTLAVGRAGIFIDYPRTNGALTVEDTKTGLIRPTINLYASEAIINWDTKQRGGKIIYTLIVLAEQYTHKVDKFQREQRDQWRVLELVNDVYTVSVFREQFNDDGARYNPPQYGYAKADDGAILTAQPTDAQGRTFDEIPFFFLGADANTGEVIPPPMEAIAEVNLAHYRNSADYEELTFVVGQPTVWAAGLQEDWVENVLKGQLRMGAQGGIPLPAGASIGILQVGPNTMAYEGMQHKERQMVALGAKLVEQAQVQRTATEAGIEYSAESSTLASVAKNVSAGFKWALEWCALFMGEAETGIKYDLNSDFSVSNMSAQDRAETIKEWQSGLITFEEARAVLHKSGVATEDDADAKSTIEAEQATAMANSVDEAAAMAAATAVAAPAASAPKVKKAK